MKSIEFKSDYGIALRLIDRLVQSYSPTEISKRFKISRTSLYHLRDKKTTASTLPFGVAIGLAEFAQDVYNIDVIDLHDWLEIIQPKYDLEVGYDDFVYGNYVVWPEVSNLPSSTISDIFERIGIELPFGDELKIYDVLDLFGDIPNNTLSIYQAFVNKLSVNTPDEESLMGSLVFQAPEEDEFLKDSEVLDLVNSVFQKYGMPSGTVYEGVGGLDDYPEEYRYRPTQE